MESDVLERFEAWRFRVYLSATNDAMLAEVAAEVRELRNIVVLGMESMKGGASVGALLEDPVVKRAYAAMAEAKEHQDG